MLAQPALSQGPPGRSIRDDFFAFLSFLGGSIATSEFGFDLLDIMLLPFRDLGVGLD